MDNYDLKNCKTTLEGWFILPENQTDFRGYKHSVTGLTLGSVGRHKETGKLHGSYATNFESDYGQETMI